MGRHAVFARTLATAFLATTSIAHAADLDGMPPIWSTVKVREDGSAFAGFYGGATLGVGFGAGAASTTANSATTTSSYQWGNSPVYSALAGYNFVAGNFVYGLEGELMRGSLGASALSSQANLTTFLDYQATLRARAGILVTPSLLLFAKLGASYAGMTFTDTASTATASAGFYGLTAGLGAEWKMTDTVSLRLDYDYNSFNASQVTFPASTSTLQPTFNTLRLGVTFKF